MMFLTNVLAPFFVGAFVSFAAMRLRDENQRAQHRADLEAAASTSVTEAQYALAMQEFLAAQDDEDRGSANAA